MKKITKLSVVVAFLICSFTIFAQEVLVVAPGTGTLNAAIATHGGNRIYQLKAGKFYQLNGIIENNGYHLQIIGEVPAAGAIPATLQTNSLGGAPYGVMFNALGSLTLKNIYFVNADFSDVIATRFMSVNAPDINVSIDHCVMNPVASAFGIEFNQSGVAMSLTNTLAMNFGNQISPNDGHFFDSKAALKSLFVENNTFVAMGTGMHFGSFADKTDGEVIWNHNTWVMQKSQLDWSVYEDRYVFTNNLMYDFNTQPWSQAWQPMPGGDVAAPKPGLIYAGKYLNEVLPSVRQQFVQYNNLNRNPGFYTLIDELNVIQVSDNVAKLTYMPLVWSAQYNQDNPVVNMRSRETILFANDTDFPEWKVGNVFDTNPQFEDARIYAHSDKMVAWTKPASLVHAMAKDPSTVAPVTEWPQWHWYEDGAKPGNNSVWPAFNGVYTNPEMLKASIEGLPLGDLNWFPADKAIWEKNKPEIDAHILAGNTDRIEMKLSTKGFNSLEKFGFNYYPNPVKNELKLSAISKISDVVVYNLLGQEIMKRALNSTNSTLDISNLRAGSYIVKVVIDKTVGTFKIVKQ